MTSGIWHTMDELRPLWFGKILLYSEKRNQFTWGEASVEGYVVVDGIRVDASQFDAYAERIDVIRETGLSDLRNKQQTN